MSFVGTRPEAVKYVEKYKPEYYATLLLPAGITSEASIRYKDEAKLTVAYYDTFKILQEFFRMVRFSGPLVFIQDDRSIRITLSGPIDPHVTFTVYRPSILSDHDRSLISLKYMKLIHLLMERS